MRLYSVEEGDVALEAKALCKAKRAVE